MKAAGLALYTHHVLIKFQIKKPKNKIENFLKRFIFFSSLTISKLLSTNNKGINEKKIKNVNPGNQDMPSNNPDKEANDNE